MLKILNIVSSYDKDIWKVAAMDRTFGSKTHDYWIFRKFWC